MAAKYQNPKGTTDFFPEERAVQKKIFDILSDVVLRYGFKEVEPPVIESMALLEAKQGEEIRKQIFTIEKKGDEQLALRAEFTPSFARMFIDKQKVIQKPVKWFSINRVWRYEKPQAGRLREFFQFNAECFGTEKPEADAEMLYLIIDLFKSLGLTDKDFFIRINNRKLLQGLLIDIAGDSKLLDVMRIIDKRDKINEEDFGKELESIGLEEDQVMKINKLMDTDFEDLECENEEAKKGYEEIKSILALLGERKKFVKVDFSTARGLAYYTGTVFEVFDTKKKFRALAGGGRYDKMIELFGGEPSPAVGFAIGYSTLSLVLEDKKLVPKIDMSPDYFIASVDDEMRIRAFDLAKRIRKTGKVVEVDLMGRKLAKQFQYADAIKAKKVVILGPDEYSKGKAKVKDMSDGKEKEVDIEKLYKN